MEGLDGMGLDLWTHLCYKHWSAVLISTFEVIGNQGDRENSDLIKVLAHPVSEQLSSKNPITWEVRPTLEPIIQGEIKLE